MSYVDGFVIAVPTANKDQFVAHAMKFDEMLIAEGALRVVECWGDDVPPGKVTDFAGAVKATDGETVCFSWVEWPDKATRDAAHTRMHARMESGEIPSGTTDMPFDGKRMIFGGFETVLELGGKP